MNTNRPKVGFAGYWRGMTAEQLAAFAAWLVSVDPAEFRCGGVLGADQQAAEVACRQTRAKLIVHRQPVARIESPILVAVAAEVIPYNPDDGKQNASLVRASDIIALAPHSRDDASGGTYRTFKFARWLRKFDEPKRPIMLFWPDGSVEEYEPDQAREPSPPTAAVADAPTTSPIAAPATTKTPTAAAQIPTPRRGATPATAKPRKAKAVG